MTAVVGDEPQTTAVVLFATSFDAYKTASKTDLITDENLLPLLPWVSVKPDSGYNKKETVQVCTIHDVMKYDKSDAERKSLAFPDEREYYKKRLIT